MNKYDKYFTFTQSRFDSLVSFAYNVGEKSLNTLLQNGTRTKNEISNKITRIYSKFYNSTSKKHERSEGLYKRILKEKELFDRKKSNPGIVHTVYNIISYRLDLGNIKAYLSKENQNEQKFDEEEDKNIIYYDLNGNSYRTKCNYECYYQPSTTYVITFINTEPIQQKGDIYIKLIQNIKISKISFHLLIVIILIQINIFLLILLIVLQNYK